MIPFRFESRLLGLADPAFDETLIELPSSAAARTEGERALAGLATEAIGAKASGAEIGVFDGMRAIYRGRLTIDTCTDEAA